MINSEYNTSKPLKIAFLTSFDPLDRRSWSGTVYYLAQSLQQHCGEVAFLGPMNIWEKYLGKVINQITLRLLKKRYSYNHSFLLAKKYAKVAKRKLAGHKYDVIITVAGAAEISFLQTDIPIVLIEDATFAILQNYYPQYSDLLKRSAYETDATEAMAIQKSALGIYSSEWAARSAIDIYGAEKSKIHVIPYGANLDSPPAQEVVLSKKRTEVCRLLFLAVDWERKGGAIAFETLQRLEQMGVEAELTVCGCVPPAQFSHPNMKVIPFLNKNDEEQRKRFEDLLLQSHFLLLPTRGDCTPIAFCEASAYGLPVITTNTGGVSGVITDGENGYMLPLSASGDAYAEVIADIYQDEQRYTTLVQSSRAAYEERLNWDAWGTAMHQLLTKLVYGDERYAGDIARV
ncbi:MAG TPA: hypothetical protein DHW02_07305 [Ktedonobacter sp.]|nr:hypothetical protein [Ktedonobacter sp.]